MTHKKKTTKGMVAGNIIMWIVALLFLFPALWIVLCSFKPGNELFSIPPTLFPENPSFTSYLTTWQENNFLQYFINSMIVAVASTLITLLINTMAGFAFAKYRFKGRDFIFMALLTTMMLPTEVIMRPTFTVVSALGLYNTLWGVIIPPIATPTGIFLMRQYFMGVPDSLLESARIDGAGEVRIFATMMVPLAKPVISTLTILSFMWRWNDYVWPMLVISDQSKYTMQLAIANLVGELAIDWNVLLCASVISMIPMLIVFALFQKQIIASVMTSGLKEG
ncbi:carbohydrate ABC transporter permease [Agathobaculum desmolans]|uniref:carbohydrate ABC transporter permease n=1 Tax=Agathobaculum desmolans TaxID=39484 RepID=UPI00248DA52F|nr:carbohydrate ABC transporter permease [Agathobaculum desmolans]